LPAHSHPVNCYNATASRGGTNPAGNILAVTNGAEIYSATPNAQMSAQMVGNTGGSQPVSVIQPYLSVNFIIALQGIFPSRN
jgi:microcystin-dependent protein